MSARGSSSQAASELQPKHALTSLTDLAHRAGEGEVSDPELTASKERFLVALARERALPRERRTIGIPRTRFLLMAATFLVAALGLVGAFVFRREPNLEYAVTGSRTQGDFVEATDDGRAMVRFSEGSELAFEAGSRGRIAEVSPRGAHVVLEHGAAHVAVNHLPHAEWSIEAGPYQVAVIGTEFEVRWSGRDLEIDLERGAVSVHGGALASDIKLVGGQRLVAHPNGELSISSLDAKTEATSPIPPSSARVEPPPTSPSASASPVKPSWTERVASGDYQAVLDEAEARGVGGVLQSGSLPDLVALGDAARYKGKMDLAKSALETQRSRFHGSSAAISAAFVLGRLSEDSLGDVSGAIAHYDEYLAEAPSGAFAAEAWGRKMNAVSRVRGVEAARPIATEVLARYPDGAYAPMARQILGSP
jgi:ferric-dicitrate binding protein FerR (iron transport regulator)